MIVTIELATAADLQHIRALLEQHNLPLDGIADRIATTLVARKDARVVGTAAIEVYGSAALMRSVAVDNAAQGQGIGQQLTQATLHLAQEQGIDDLYLLTQTAADFFPRFGFKPIDRMDVAPAVQQSVEFTTACPDSALAMACSITLG